ncbi:MAG: hypothetical protein NC299_12805 [Lachnospiraceae bacterium]|nr:hypothetical protein [Ruminococcus sp.]MCM1276217.1 hypothetical protein [Lachnospiraceae bacterium]
MNGRIAALAAALCLFFGIASCADASVGNEPCGAFALYCVDDGELLDAENIDGRIAPASLTKLLTAATALRYVSADEVFTVGSEQELVNPNSSVSFILQGHEVRLYDLIAAMLLVSGNDAAYTVAVSTARRVSGEALSDKGAVEYFCGLMNALAEELGMDKSRFANPDGWDNKAHYTAVSDLLKLAEYALTVPEIREIASMREYYAVFESGENVTWTNSNKLLDPDSEYYREGAFGLKTGTTERAGCCLIGAFSADGKTYITVAVGCDTDAERYERTLELIDKCGD